MSNNHKTFFSKFDHLVLEIFVIGYPDKGESQIILLKDNEKVFFSCVIDCYRHNEVNKTLEILKSNNVNFLNMFIWTHTDEDHSLDISKIVTEYCTKHTSFILPEFIYGNSDDLVDYNEEIKTSFNLINSLNKGRNYNVSSVTAAPYGHSSIWSNTFIDEETTIKFLFEVIVVAPCSGLLRRKYESKSISKKNDFSIATIFKVGDLNLFFAGDVEDQTINQIADYHFRDIKFIKTPHHTSPSSIKFIKKIKNTKSPKTLKSVSTIYRQHNLPHPEVVTRYKEISESFISTGMGNHDSGIDYTKFHVTSGIIIDEKFQGNCNKVF